MLKPRILALDHGTKRIGVAVSDEMGWTAQPLETFERRTIDKDLAHIHELVRIQGVDRVVLGLPLRLNGEEGPAAQAVRRFADQLERVLAVPVVMWDERMTTKSAEDLLIAADVGRKKRKGIVDRVAAAILLQSYLESLAPADDRSAERIEEDITEVVSTILRERVSADEDNHAAGHRAPGGGNRHRRRSRVSGGSMG